MSNINKPKNQVKKRLNLKKLKVEKVGNRKGAPPIDQRKVQKAKELYMMGEFSEDKIAKDCGMATRTFRKYRLEGKWKEERDVLMSQIQNTASSRRDPVELTKSEADVRGTQFKLAQTQLAALSDHFLNVGIDGKIKGRKKGIPLKDIKLGADILKTLQGIVFKALGLDSDNTVAKEEQARITQMIISVINETIPDPTLRKQVLDGLVETEKRLEGKK